MKFPNPNMLLRIAQGDSYGLATEYIKFPRDQESKDKALEFKKYIKHPRHSLKAGQYSDDGQMSLGLAECLINTYPNTQSSDYSKYFFDCFKRDQREGYSSGFQGLLESCNSDKELVERLIPDSDKNGAAMRSVPLGVIKDLQEVKYQAISQAKITHNTFGGMWSSVIVAYMSHYSLYVDQPLSELPKWINDQLSSWIEPISIWDGSPVVGPNVGMRTATAVLTLVSQEKSLLEIAKTTIEWGGDTDSVLSIAWGIASARMNDELPSFFEYGLENGTYGKDYLIKKGNELMQKFNT